MSQTKITLRSIKELDSLKFMIPNYQRGYRWDEQQVKDLLKDIREHQLSEESGIYCLQPLVVKQCLNDENELMQKFRNADSLIDIRRLIERFDDDTKCLWEVIDGQQRLTTICIIQQYLLDKLQISNSDIYSIQYQTLTGTINGKDTKEYINNISILDSDVANENINLHFMFEAYQTIKQWFNDWDVQDLRAYYTELRDKVKFIWYQTEEDDPIQVFTRLNIGRISLTSSELIKAIFLNRDNFEGSEIFAKQRAIALQWDLIENQLQDEEFWLFLLDKKEQEDWKKPTRIDFILDFICKYDSEFIYEDKEVGTDQYRTFRCFYKKYEELKSQKKPSGSTQFLDYWNNKIKNIFDTFSEWYNDGRFYHYIGYLLTLTSVAKISEKRYFLYQLWNDCDRTQFYAKLKEEITSIITPNLDLEKVYKVITQTRPLLLLHNLILVLQTNKVMQENSKYNGRGIFYKFPFHLFKIEKWNVEHIDSNTPNDLSKKSDCDNWILSTYMSLSTKEKSSITVKDLLAKYFAPSNTAWISFSDAKKILLGILKKEDTNDRDWTNKIYNFTLLDEHTNKSYHNAIFSSKRMHIVGKELGELKIAEWDRQANDIKEVTEKVNSAFVPSCTMKIFQKTWSTFQGDITSWTLDDALSYKEEIEKSIKWFTAN